ncbi:hypothetical protein [Phocaeicola salanitronis]|uniref:hypothetical protein n=1 Tax=Phocaeicola salanitronis TaxID=376805 RepID=UPI0023F63854|nr:hypothetical protein [Phocaeicola salanitronis]
MATLNFTKNGDKWVAEATVNKDYMLYLQKSQMACLKIFQRQEETDEWGQCDTRVYPFLNYSTVCYRLSHGAYPMHVRFECDAEVLEGRITEVDA